MSAPVATPRRPHTMNLATRQLHARLYTDGASRGNPGPAACGGVIYLAEDKVSPEHEATADPIYYFGKSLGCTTNNVAEYKGLLQGLEAARDLGVTHLTVYVDSQLVCRQIQGQYAVKHAAMLPLHAQCRTVMSQMQHVTINHVLRAFNKIADRLCNVVLDDLCEPSMDLPDFTLSSKTGLSPDQLQEQMATQLPQPHARTRGYRRVLDSPAGHHHIIGARLHRNSESSPQL
jgi:ribonuclease HI